MFSDIKTVLTKKRNKPRLLLALYARPKHPDAPHYALLVTPNIKPGPHNLGAELELIAATKYHIKNTLQKIKDALCQPWVYEHVDVPNLDRDHNILVCTVIAKVLSIESLEKIMTEIYIYQKDDPIQFKARDFDCKMWCHDAYEELQKSGVIVGLDWRTAEGGTRAVLNQRHGEGRWASSITGACRVNNLPCSKWAISGEGEVGTTTEYEARINLWNAIDGTVGCRAPFSQRGNLVSRFKMTMTSVV